MAKLSSMQHEQLLSDYVDLWNGDFSKIDVVSESVEVSDPGAPGGTVRGRDGLEAYLESLHSGFPDFHVTIDDALEGDDVVMAAWTVTGTHEGEFNGMAPTDREITLNGMDEIRIAGGEVREHQIFYDVRGMLEQLGVSVA